ncbi:MAG: YtpR family tRNA-binding protein, partial [Metamycoplasmataceae bacterium]
SKIFDEGNNLIIVFSAFSGEITSKIKENYVFIYGEDNSLLGINIFNYKNEFSDIKEGYHKFSDENFAKIAKKFPNEMKKTENKNFFVTAIVKEINNHPKNDRLKILLVETKDNKRLRIITNVVDLKIGSKYLFAIKNAFLATGMIIDETKIMGEQSQGMICSWKSLGIEKEGLIVIHDNKDFNF